jgi:hypothetical protein
VKTCGETHAVFSWELERLKGVPMTKRTKHKPNEVRIRRQKPTAYERTRARQAGASIEQLRAERRDAERMIKLNSGGPKAD